MGCEMGGFFDSHLHTRHSHDGRQTLEELCQAALELGLAGVAVTDHADQWFLKEDDALRHIAASAAEARAADRRLEGRLRVFSGVEMGEARDDPAGAAEVLALAEYDVVLGSIHSVRFEGWNDAYSRIPFDASVPEETVARFLGAYFEKVLDMAAWEDFDVLTHLTCPLRYINGKYDRRMSLEPYSGVIAEILRCVIRRGKALEVNTSGCAGGPEGVMPTWNILREYYKMGGRLLTLGSDAHESGRVGNAFPRVAAALREAGFSEYCHYERRRPVLHPLSAR